MSIAGKHMRRVFIGGTIVCLLLAIAYALRLQSRRERCVVTDKITLLDEVAANPSAFKGHLVTTICYLWTGGGLGLSTMPSKNRWRFNKELGRNVCLGTDMPARGPSGGWDQNMPVEYFEDPSSRDDKLVIVQGYVFDTGYAEPGQLLEKEPYIRIVSIRMLDKVIVKPSAYGAK